MSAEAQRRAELWASLTEKFQSMANMVADKVHEFNTRGKTK